MLCSGSAVFCQTEPVEVHVRSFDGVYTAAALRKPPGEKPMPAILFLHGGVGGSAFAALKSMTRARVPDYFLKRGFVIMAADYRGYHFGEDEIQDALAAVRQLESYPYVDKKRIAIIGGSHGGYLAAMAATRTPLAAVVSLAGLTDIEDMFFDWAQEFRKGIRDYEDWRNKLTARSESARESRIATEFGKIPPGTAVKLPQAGTPPYQIEVELAWRFGARRELYRDISVKENASRIKCPLLFLVGGNDKLRFAGKALVDDLKARGATAVYSEHEGMDHGFYWGAEQNPPRQFHDALKVMTDFVERAFSLKAE
ncbi:MAG: alpha/beta fold hydrolase [Candidatus Solibacter usitatus]|nr:alpha/beta fold hydrolase [Candidatus Solibacter usitatus]